MLDHPLTLDYYLSHPVNAFSEDNTYTQDDANEQCEFEFKQDSIIETIGTRECKFAIDNFWKEIFDSFRDDDQKRNFFSRIMNKLVEVYDLQLLDQYSSDHFIMDDFKKELPRILIFFETPECCTVFADIFYSKSLEEIVNDKEQLKQYLDLYYDIAIQKMVKFKNNMSPWLYYIFNMMAKDEFIELVMKQIDRYTNEFLTEIATRKGTKHVDNQDSFTGGS